jgi:outer membrane protein assembly factor BamD
MGLNARISSQTRYAAIPAGQKKYINEINRLLMVKLPKLVVILCVCVLISGCSYFKGDKDKKKSPDENWSADRTYSEAKQALDSGYYNKATEYYEKLQTRYPFGKYAEQTLLDLAYAYYKSEEYESAVATVDRFIKLYPTHATVDYALYLKGLAQFNEGKGLTQRFLPIDQTQRDPSSANKAYQSFAEVVKRFPKSKYVPDARKRMEFLRNQMAQHEVNIAQYYMRRSAYIAAANRARYVVENYQRAPAVPDALAIMARAYKILGLTDLSNDALRVLKMNKPDHPGIKEVTQTVVR